MSRLHLYTIGTQSWGGGGRGTLSDFLFNYTLAKRTLLLHDVICSCDIFNSARVYRLCLGVTPTILCIKVHTTTTEQRTKFSGDYLLCVLLIRVFISSFHLGYVCVCVQKAVWHDIIYFRKCGYPFRGDLDFCFIGTDMIRYIYESNLQPKAISVFYRFHAGGLGVITECDWET